MMQRRLPNFPAPNKIVNVASVKHRSPFRYPGGKTWFVPRIRQWLYSLSEQPTLFIEPFAGGAIVGLTVAAEQLAEHVMLVELDEQIAAVWETVITDEQAEWLADAIVEFDLTSDHVDVLLSNDVSSRREEALQTIVKNRVNRGGILAEGAGMMKAGENGKGLSSRWYPETLARRIRDIARIQDRLTFHHADGLAIIEKYAERADAAFFIDPPYTAGGKKAGRRLYNYSELDHERLFELASSVKGNVVMTYSNSTEVRDLAEAYGLEVQPIAMKNTHHAKMTELVIGQHLDWIRASTSE